jgi:hypothetical protein
MVELREAGPLVDSEIEREMLDFRVIAQARESTTMAFQKSQRVTNLMVGVRAIGITDH